MPGNIVRTGFWAIEVGSEGENGDFLIHNVTVTLLYIRHCCLTAILPCLVHVVFRLFENQFI